MNRAQTLTKATETVCGDRDLQYGAPEDNFAIIATYWTTYLHGKGISVAPVHADDVAAMMVLFKMGRITTNNNSSADDTWIDIAGYAACGCEIMGNQCE